MFGIYIGVLYLGKLQLVDQALWEGLPFSKCPKKSLQAGDGLDSLNLIIPKP